MTGNRTREIRPSGIAGGPPGNVVSDQYARAWFLPDPPSRGRNEGPKPVADLRSERFVSPIYGQLPGFADHVFKVSTAERIDVTAGRKKE